MTKLLLSLSLLLLLDVSAAWSQQTFDLRSRTDISVMDGNGLLTDPWTGGWNSPQFSAIDLNQDGKEDLFVFDRAHYKVSTYLAVQTEGKWHYRYTPEYEAIFPPMQAWALLRDYNCDGLKDLFTRGQRGIMVYRQELSADGKVTFALAEELLYFNETVNLFVGVEDLPSITDLDNDGDLDILVYEWSGGATIHLYRNLQTEQDLPCGELKFTLETNHWGQIGRCAGTCNTYLFGAFCRLSKPTHVGGSSLLAIDLNSDGVKDVLMGHENCEDLVSMYNTGTPTTASFSAHQKNIPGQIPPGMLGFFPAAYFEDVTFDGIKDLIVAPNATANGHENVNMSQSVGVYPNTGTDAAPRFDAPRQPFGQHGMIDVGEGSAPAFADLDGDGLLDLLVGNYADLRGDQYVASISHYRNTGSPTKPAFALVTNDYLHLSAQGYLSLRPHLSDVNGDAAVDLVFAAINSENPLGKVRYILNMAPAGRPADFPVSTVQELQGITSNPLDTPFFYDINDDGRQDLLIGTNSGALRYYRNTGTSASPAWENMSDSFGGIGVDPDRRFLHPIVTDLNHDGKPDLVTGDDSGLIRIYPDFQSHLGESFPVLTEVFYNPQLNLLQDSYLGRRLAPAAADLTGDGYPELVVGSMTGGLVYFAQHDPPPGKPQEKPPGLVVRIFPNPAPDDIVQVESSEPAQVALYDTAGRLIYRSEGPYSTRHRVPVAKLKQGIYFVRVSTDTGTSMGRSLLIQR